MMKKLKITMLCNLIQDIITCYNADAINNEELREWTEYIIKLITEINKDKKNE